MKATMRTSCEDEAEMWKTERLEYANHQLEIGDDPGDTMTYQGEIDWPNGNVLAEEYYNNSVRRKLDAIPTREPSQPTISNNPAPDDGQVTDVSSATICPSSTSLGENGQQELFPVRGQ